MMHVMRSEKDMEVRVVGLQRQLHQHQRKVNRCGKKQDKADRYGSREASIGSAFGTVASLLRVKRFDFDKTENAPTGLGVVHHCGYEKYVKIPYHYFD